MPVPLTPRVFETLLYMVEHHDAVLDKERIMEAVWPDSIVEENNLTQNISALRRVFGETPGSHRFIVTVPGRGYRFVANVRMRETDAGPETEDNIRDRNRTCSSDRYKTSCFGFSTGSPSRQPQFQANLAGERSRSAYCALQRSFSGAAEHKIRLTIRPRVHLPALSFQKKASPCCPSRI